MADDATTEQRLREILGALDAEGNDLAAIYVAMAVERLNRRTPPDAPDGAADR